MRHRVVQRGQITLLRFIKHACLFRPLVLPTILISALAMLGLNALAAASELSWIPMNQGTSWTAETRAAFYSGDQGSRLIPLRWIAALKQANGLPCMADSLARYGYLPNEISSPAGLPVGFTVANTTNGETLGMTCAACHTRQITVQTKAYRIDGGPAIVDIQSFLTDLDLTVRALLNGPSGFDAFSHAILGSSPTPEQAAALRQEVKDWYLPFHTIITDALPQPSWGPGRLDAISMIFNRLTGLDIGPPPTYIIEDNIQRADAPARYPFLWNAYRQDHTQWPGFADNGNTVLGLGRNASEVTGVFSAYHAKKDSGRLLGINFVGDNSTNFDGLITLEGLTRKIGPPKWIWPIDTALAAQGRTIFSQNCATKCHEVRRGEIRSLNPFDQTWATPIQNVGTDTREWSILDRKVNPGVLTGAYILGLSEPLKDPDLPLTVLQVSVVGSIIQHALPVVVPDDFSAQVVRAGTVFTPETESLKGAFRYGPQRACAGQLRVARFARHLGRRSVSAQWLCADSSRIAQTPTRAGSFLQNRPRVRPRHRGTHRRAAGFHPIAANYGLQPNKLRQQSLRPRLRHASFRQTKESFA